MAASSIKETEQLQGGQISLVGRVSNDSHVALGKKFHGEEGSMGQCVS
jgi:hypothetical protein